MAFSDIGKMTMWIGGIGLLWNLLGLAAFVNQMTMDTSSLPELQRTFHDTTPVWARAAFFVAVTAGTAGCIGLLTGQDWARIAFALSLAGILLQNLHAFLLSNGLQAFGPGGAVMPVLVIAIAAYLLYYSNSLTAN